MNQKNLILSDTINDSLQKLTTGSGIVFLGTMAGMVLFYISRILIGRFFTPAEYGIFSLGVIFVYFFTLISLLGLQEGVSRQIAFYLGKADFLKLKKTIFSSIRTVLLSSLAISIGLFFLSEFISIKIFHNPLFSDFLKIFIISIPIFSLIFIFTSIARGFGRMKENVYFQQILRNGLFLLFLIFIIWLGLSFKSVVNAFLLSSIFTAILFLIYIGKESFYLKEELKPSFFYQNLGLIDRELLFFSLPLLGIGLLDNLNSWIDTLILGYLKSTELVGIYNGALPFAKFIPLILTSVGFLYLPVVTKLYSQNLKKEVKRIYAISTKWIFFTTLPLFLVIFLFSKTILVKFLGINYITASLPLQILALGFLIHILFGLNGITLLAFGETKFLMWTSLFATIIGVILNISLIPTLGIIGASIATASIFLIAKVLRSGKLYFSYKVHPFTKNYLKPVLLMMIFFFIIYKLTKNIILTWWMLPLFFILFLALSFLSIFLTKSIDSEEIAMLVNISKKIGLEFSWLEGMLQKFT
jgi:O-antigen/teichoic acid export membrane protein